MQSIDLDSSSLDDLIRLKDVLLESLSRRFERMQCLGFTDIVGSTAYFERYGDKLGRILQQRHLDLLSVVLAEGKGRLIDTAGDGAFTCWDSVEGALESFVRLQQAISRQNRTRAREHQLTVRIGLHWGPVLTDGRIVSGDAVNLCARVASCAGPGEIVLTREAFQELPNRSRVYCRPGPVSTLKGISRSIELVIYEWRDRSLYPGRVRILETGAEFVLPQQDTISFGRLGVEGGVLTNDIVLELPDSSLSRQISRWHFELRRGREGFVLRALSDRETAVDGTVIARGSDFVIKPGSIVRLAGVMSLLFLGDPTPAGRLSEPTMIRRAFEECRDPPPL